VLNNRLREGPAIRQSEAAALAIGCVERRDDRWCIAEGGAARQVGDSLLVAHRGRKIRLDLTVAFPQHSALALLILWNSGGGTAGGALDSPLGHGRQRRAACRRGLPLTRLQRQAALGYGHPYRSVRPRGGRGPGLGYPAADRVGHPPAAGRGAGHRASAPELAAGIARVKSAEPIGVRSGNWLTLLTGAGAPERAGHRDRQGARDRAIHAVLLGCVPYAGPRWRRPPMGAVRADSRGGDGRCTAHDDAAPVGVVTDSPSAGWRSRQRTTGSGRRNGPPASRA